MLEGLVGHHRPEVRPADSDVDDVAHAPACVALPDSAADAIGEVSHSIEYGVNSRYDVLAIDDDGCASRSAQGDVQDRPVLRDVDLVASKHGVNPRTQTGFAGQLQQQLQSFVGDAVLRV